MAVDKMIEKGGLTLDSVERNTFDVARSQDVNPQLRQLGQEKWGSAIDAMYNAGGLRQDTAVRHLRLAAQDSSSPGEFRAFAQQKLTQLSGAARAPQPGRSP